jgi:hypothetical protein
LAVFDHTLDYRSYTLLFLFVFANLASQAQSLSPRQIKQVEEIRKNISGQNNANKQAHLDDMTVSFNSFAIGRNVRLEYVVRTKQGLSPNIVKEWLDAISAEIIPGACAQNESVQNFV